MEEVASASCQMSAGGGTLFANRSAKAAYAKSPGFIFPHWQLALTTDN
jgi:hypothetical protein